LIINSAGTGVSNTQNHSARLRRITGTIKANLSAMFDRLVETVYNISTGYINS
jgi:hypothetical protein